MSDLDDAKVLHFINQGMVIFRPRYPDGFHEAICAGLGKVEGDPRNQITDHVPELLGVFEHPAVRGALDSLMGPGWNLHVHRQFYNNRPGSQSQGWHVDAPTADHMLHSVTLFYYPHDVTAEMGPTILIPGTHFRDAPMDRLTSYANVRGQKVFLGGAGTLCFMHPDLWHARSLNRSERDRYMVKFVVERAGPPTQPSWQHDPATAEALFLQKCREFVGPVKTWCTDYLHEWEWRRKLWNWMRGVTAQAPNLMDFLVG